jgi:hypothetical protein
MQNFLSIHPDSGEVEILIDREPWLRYEFVVPAPFASDEDRALLVQQAKDSIWLHGLHVAACEPVHNDAFDEPGKQTSTRLVARPCMDEEEAHEVAKELNRITFEASA